MEKLIFEHNWCIPYEAQGTEAFAFEYKSKIHFQCFVFDLIDDAKRKRDNVELFGWTFEDLSELEKEVTHKVYTLDEWFEKKQKQYKI